MSSAGHGPELGHEELARLEERFTTTCLQAVALGVLTPAEVTTIQRRLHQMRRRNVATAASPPSSDQR